MGGSIGIPMAHQKTNGAIGIPMGQSHWNSNGIGPLEIIGDNCQTPDQTKIKSNQTKNLERLYNCLVSFFLVCRHAQNSSDVTLAFEDAD